MITILNIYRSIIIVFMILVAQISILSKIILIMCILFLYRINVKIMTELFLKISFIEPIYQRKDDTIPRSIVNSIFNSNFILNTEFDKLPSHPSILICNYCSDRIENLSCILFPIDIAIMMRESLKTTMFLHKLVKWPIFTKLKGNFEDTKLQIKHHIKAGRSVFTYITRPPKIRPNIISGIRSGTFRIAKDLNTPITLVCIDYVDTLFGSITKQNFRIRVGKTFMVKDIAESIKITKTFFKDTMNEFIKRKYEFDY